MPCRRPRSTAVSIDSGQTYAGSAGSVGSAGLVDAVARQSRFISKTPTPSR